MKIRQIGILMAAAWLTGCSEKNLFEPSAWITAGAETWWARSHTDVNGDGLLDFFLIHNNAYGGWLGWYETLPGLDSSVQHIIARSGPDGGLFACGDLDSGDIDGDGDVDVLGPVGPGEWQAGEGPVRMFWYENPSWESHYIGEFPLFVKDMDLVDLDGDGKLDIAATCYPAHRMVAYRQTSAGPWQKIADEYVPVLHEGQHAGDLDGDGDMDVVSTAYWFENPGGDFSRGWTARNIDPYWNSDTGSTWEYNATKIYCLDIDQDQKDEVFISCSEKFRDRIAWYDSEDPQNGSWTMHPIGSNSFAHTLQAGDLDGDGDVDVISGNNGGQGDPDNSPVKIFLNQGDNLTWSEVVISTTGAYNSYLGDVDGDGDLDFFRYAGHEATRYELWLNQTE